MANYIFSYTDNSNFWCDIFPKFPKVFDMFLKQMSPRQIKAYLFS